MPDGKRSALDGAFNEALKRQEAQKQKHEQDLAELTRIAEEGKRAGRRVGLIVVAVIAVIALAVLVVMLKDPASRAISLLLMLILGMGAAFKFWKASN